MWDDMCRLDNYTEYEYEWQKKSHCLSCVPFSSQSIFLSLFVYAKRNKHLQSVSIAVSVALLWHTCPQTIDQMRRYIDGNSHFIQLPFSTSLSHWCDPGFLTVAIYLLGLLLDFQIVFCFLWLILRNYLLHLSLVCLRDRERERDQDRKEEQKRRIGEREKRREKKKRTKRQIVIDRRLLHANRGYSHFRLMIIWLSHLLLWIQSIGLKAKLFVFESNEFFIR